MNSVQGISKKDRIQSYIFSTSWKISLFVMIVVVVLEIFMLCYTLINPALYGPYIGRYRGFYITLLAFALVYIVLVFFVKKDTIQRYRILSLANPLFMTIFFAWSIGITWSDAIVTGKFDCVVFMTFSLTVFLSFSMSPVVYGILAGIADLMLGYLALTYSGTSGILINLLIFFIFQLIMGISFLRLKIVQAEHIVQEEESAVTDVMTGIANRRSYENAMNELSKEGLGGDFVYVVLDINGLKGVNDQFGHDAGDRMIISMTKCMEDVFGKCGSLYRIGGDEFVALLMMNRETLERTLEDFHSRLASLKMEEDYVLSATCGYAYHSDHPESSVFDLAKLADAKLYEEKVRFYQESGRNRRRY